MRGWMTAAATVMTVLAVGCASAPGGSGAPTPAAPGAATQPAPAAAVPAEISDAVHWVRNSAEYRALALTIYHQALAAVERRAAGKAPGTWGVGLDADDTVIDNSGYAKEREEKGEKHSDAAWAEWVKRRERPAVPGAVEFLRAVRERGGRIAIVTNTVQELCDDTEANLQAEGLVYDLVLCRTMLDHGRKEARWRRIAEGLARPGLGPIEIVVWVGDNIQDFPEQTQDLRLRPEPAFADFGDKYFVLPNPVYGSWQSNPRQ